MNIGILLGAPGISGGSYVVYEHASHLRRSGHRVAIITRQEVRAEAYAWHPSACALDWLTLNQARTERFDLALATWWETFFRLHQLKADHYAYFVQSIESRFFAPPDPYNFHSAEYLIWKNVCEQTYACVIPVITEAAWIQEYLHRHYNKWPHLVRNGIRKDIYTADGAAAAARRPGLFRVLVEGPVEVPFKNVPAALRIAKEAGADEVWLLTSSAVQSHPHADRVFSRLPIHETPAVYRSCDLVLKLSYIEGMFGPPLEMFHCGGTAVVYDVTGHDEYIVHDRNAYVVPKDDEAQAVRLLRRLKDDPAELERLKQGAAQTAAAWPDWQTSSAQFEQALLEIAAGPPASRAALVCSARQLLQGRKPFVRAKTQQDLAAREQADWKGAAAASQHNFIRFLWSRSGDFSDDLSQQRHYLSGAWTTVSFTVRAEAVPLWLRLDPSVRIGMVDCAAIRVRNLTQDKELMSFQEKKDFQGLYLTGHLKWLFPERQQVMFCYGPRPIMVLPKIEAQQAEIGDQLEVSVQFRETGMQQFFDEHLIQVIGRRDPLAEAEGRDNLLQLHWDSQGQFSADKAQLRHYRGADWAELSCAVRADALPLWLRISPSRRSGVLEIASIVVRNLDRGAEIMAFREPQSFGRLLLDGGAAWLFSDRQDILCVSGPASAVILPQIEQDQAAAGDLIEVAVRLRESEVPQFFARHPFRFAEGTRPPDASWRQRLLRRMRN